MTIQERQKLIDESDALEAKLSTAEFPSPSDLRRVGQIRSLLLTDGETETLNFSASKPTGKARISRGISFRADHFEWLEQYKDRSAVVQKALSILIPLEEMREWEAIEAIKSNFQNLKK